MSKYRKYKKNLSPLEKLLGSFYRAMQPKERLKVSEWMEKNFYLTKNSEPGIFRFKRTPYTREIADALGVDSPYMRVVVKKSSQVGLSTIAEGWMGYCADYAKSSIMMVMPNEKVLKRASRNKVQPMIDASPALRKIFSEKKSRDSANSATEKEFDGGTLYLASAAASSDLSSIPVRFANSDEYSRFPLSVQGEGSASDLIDARMITYGKRSKHLKNSTPTIEGECLVSKDYELTDKRNYFMPCPSCRELITFEFENLKWSKDEKGNHLADTAYYEAPCCGFKIEEMKHKTKMMEKGQWIATEKNPKDKLAAGFYINGLYSPVGWLSWADIAGKWIKGHKDKESRISFLNTILGLAYKESNKDIPKVDLLMMRRESWRIGVVPAEAKDCLLLAGIDVQGDRLECTVRAVRLRPDDTEEHWIIDHKIFYGDTVLGHPLKDVYFDSETGEEIPTSWGQLYNYLTTPLDCSDGSKKPIIGAAIDSGFKAHLVYMFARRFKRGFLRIVKGQDLIASRQVVGAPVQVDIDFKGKKIKNGARLYSVSVNLTKQMVYGYINTPAPTKEQLEENGYPSNYVHFPLFEKEYFDQLTAEAFIRQRDPKTGKLKEYFKPIRDRNETLDCFGYTIALWYILKLDTILPENWDAALIDIENTALDLIAPSSL